MDETIDKKNEIVMKLLHYFITEKNYNPIILQGAENEIWLENMDSEYKIVRIVSNHIHNEEQFEYDLFKTKHVVKKIKRKTLTFNMNVLSIFTDVRENVELDNQKNYDCIYINDEKDIKKFNFVTNIFPDIVKKLKFSEEGMQLFIKITSDINKKNKKDQVQAEDIFKPKKPIITYTLISINVLVFAIMILFNLYEEFINKFALFGPFVVELKQVYRLFSSGFIHANIMHLLFNSYALFIIGSQIESFLGKTKYLIIYFFSMLSGSLLSIILSKGASVGASGAIFGLMGAMLCFGHYYRAYIGTAVRSQIVPLIVVNLIIGFIFKDHIDSFAHIGGLIGGFLITGGLGIKYKSSTFDKTNGLIISILFILGLGLLAFKFVG